MSVIFVWHGLPWPITEDLNRRFLRNQQNHAKINWNIEKRCFEFVFSLLFRDIGLMFSGIFPPQFSNWQFQEVDFLSRHSKPYNIVYIFYAYVFGNVHFAIFHLYFIRLLLCFIRCAIFFFLFHILFQFCSFFSCFSPSFSISWIFIAHTHTRHMLHCKSSSSIVLHRHRWHCCHCRCHCHRHRCRCRYHRIVIVVAIIVW